ncbi:hypothetical protein F511_29834 [Dorcoceras hygrometricum]|uniref:Dystroglycan-like n=1 Tax=Dorcoceras hygrometricum TaxID=472368 RepID=A0A2Z7C713_9LAMI|nr:hypothetical protein F511_29834 [Dorcoceras hygrometricum]
MKTSKNKRFSRKHDRKVLVAEESTKSWADSDSDSSSSSSSSSDSEQEEVHCFMADQTDEDELQVESHCQLQLKVLCSGGTVASSQGDNLRWKVPVDWCTSRKVYQSRYTSRHIPVEEHQSQGALTFYHSSEMASSLISRSHHIDFDSVFHFDDAGIVQMFESLVSMGLMEFLGCPAIFHEQALIEFFEHGSVRDGMVVSVIGGMTVEISESVFAAAFGLPTEGLTDLSEVPKDLLSKAQRLFSASEKEVSVSCLKKEVKMQYHLLSDILAKSIFFKAGSFDAVTRYRFLLMTAINFDVKVNWGNILFGVLKEMVTPDSRQAKGYAIQICALLKNISGLELGESKAFPAPRILNEKTVHRIVSVNENVGVEEQEHGIIFEQPCSSTAVDYAEYCGAVFARFFSVAKSSCWVRPLICVDGIWTPLQGPDFWRSGCRLSLFLNKVEMPAPAVQDIFGHSVSFIKPTQYWEAAPFLPKTWAGHCVCTEVFPFCISGRLRPASCSTNLVVYRLDVQKLPAYLLDDFQRGIHTDCFAGYFGSSVVLSDSDILSDSSSGCTVCRSPSPVENPFDLGPAIFSRVDQAEQPYFVQSPVSPPAAFSHQESSSSSSDVSIHFDSEDFPMRAPEAAHTSAPVDSHVSTASLKDLRSYFSKRIDESTSELRSKVNEVEFNVRGDLAKQQAWLRQMFHNSCDILERQSTQINDLKKGLVAPVGTIFQDLFDIKKNDRAHEAKLNALDGQVAALRNDQLEFQNRISADLLSLSTQFADIVEFIRGGDAKKGESGSSSRPPPVRVERRPLPIPPSPRDVAGSSGAVRIPTLPRTTGTFEERVEQARRHLLESGLVISVEEAANRIRQADFEKSDRFQRERERARREKRSSSSRRRRGS